mgnify:CR=1 FL=1
MTLRTRIFFGSIAAGLVVLVAFLLYTRPAAKPLDPEEFAAWEPEVVVEEAQDSGALVPRSGYRPATTATDNRDRPQAARREYRQGDVDEDTLNRPGPQARQAPGEEAAPEDVAPPRGVAPEDTLSHEAIRDGIEVVRPLVKVCYEDALKEFPDAAGKVTLSFRIAAEDEEGRVELSELDRERTTLFDEKLHDCMMESVAEATFPAPGAGGVVNVTYPFVFQTDEEVE